MSGKYGNWHPDTKVKNLRKAPEIIRLEEITPENWRFDLRVEESQKNYVSDGMRLLARAYAYRNYNIAISSLKNTVQNGGKIHY